MLTLEFEVLNCSRRLEAHRERPSTVNKPDDHSPKTDGRDSCLGVGEPVSGRFLPVHRLVIDYSATCHGLSRAIHDWSGHNGAFNKIHIFLLRASRGDASE
ncbi:hypothetical protein J6590_048841 [Homalodisca vitripennis]|nr:hypothetical protein J6590_005086 [Homalodisca vitripennis]KAG8301644.1 hypothetical protein J6590_048841 [Homalodisca vitripennis]